jgi:nucleotide-binding universal stress UspA family protein
VAFAREAGYDVEPVLVQADRAIAMGQRGRSGLKTALLGSVSRDVVNAYHRPVILV